MSICNHFAFTFDLKIVRPGDESIVLIILSSNRTWPQRKLLVDLYLPACLELRLFARVVIVTEETTEPSVGQQVR